jgi:hypothetical protein
MIAERTIQYAQRVADPVLGFRVRYAIQVQIIDRMGFTRMKTVGYACDATHVAKVKEFLI